LSGAGSQEVYIPFPSLFLLQIFIKVGASEAFVGLWAEKLETKLRLKVALHFFAFFFWSQVFGGLFCYPSLLQTFSLFNLFHFSVLGSDALIFLYFNVNHLSFRAIILY
jgi:hypothetical protein